MIALVSGSLFLLSILASPADEPKAPGPNEKVEKGAIEKKEDKKENGKASPKAGIPAGKVEAAPPARPASPPISESIQIGLKFPEPPRFKTPESEEKYKEGLRKLELEDYPGARSIFNTCMKDAVSPADKKVIQGLIDDTKLGLELEAARKQVDQKEPKKALARIDKALKANPTSAIRPYVDKFIQETEEQVYLILDDFEPGGSLQQETAGRDASDPGRGDSSSSSSSSSRWKRNQSFNADPRFVMHGKGSMKWRVGGYTYSSYSYYYYGYGYQSAELKNPITNWKYLVFWVFLPEDDVGTLRISLAPTLETGVIGSLYNQKLTDLRGKKGWLPVKLDLNKDFGNTKNVKLEDIRYVRIDYFHVKYRTIYLDFIHFE